MCRVCKLHYATSPQTEAYWANAVLSTVYDLMSARDIKVIFVLTFKRIARRIGMDVTIIPESNWEHAAEFAFSHSLLESFGKKSMVRRLDV
jgi:hypothetical protein